VGGDDGRFILPFFGGGDNRIALCFRRGLIIFRLFIYIFSTDERNTPPHTRKRTTGIGLEPVAPPPKNKRQYDGVVAAAAASSEDDDAANTGVINSNNGPVMKRTEIDDLLRGG
jgi:hypothetical protein